MSNEKEGNSGSRKKFLYLDKFITHVTGDEDWKKKTTISLTKLKDKVDNFIWIALLGCCLGLAALLISVMK